MNNDNVFEKDGAWYFWDETGTDYIGPYSDSDEAFEGMKRYAESLDKERFSD